MSKIQFTTELVWKLLEDGTPAAFLPENEDNPVFRVNGKEAKKGSFSTITSASRVPMLGGDLPEFFLLLNEEPLHTRARFTISYDRAYAYNGWYNTPVVAEIAIGETYYRGYINQWGAKNMTSHVIVNPPQWKLDGKFIPILAGKLTMSLTNAVEQMIRDNHSVALPVHQAYCSKCTYFETYISSEEGGEVYGCGLGQFIPFSWGDVVDSDLMAAAGLNEDGTSNLACDNTWAWTEGEEVAILTASEWREIGHLLGEPYYTKFCGFDRYFYDTMWMDRILRNAGGDWSKIEDFDSMIEAERNKWLQKAQNIWAQRLPEYDGLFLKTSHELTNQVTAPETTIKAKKVRTRDWLDREILRPCCLGMQYKTNKKDGKVKCYRYQDIPYCGTMDVFNDFVRRYNGEERIATHDRRMVMKIARQEAAEKKARRSAAAKKGWETRKKNKENNNG